jgi:hypothetical protein
MRTTPHRGSACHDAHVAQGGAGLRWQQIFVTKPQRPGEWKLLHDASPKGPQDSLFDPRLGFPAAIPPEGGPNAPLLERVEQLAHERSHRFGLTRFGARLQRFDG